MLWASHPRGLYIPLSLVKKFQHLMDCKLGGTCYDSNTFHSVVIEGKAKQIMVDLNCPKDSEKTTCVCIVSDCDRTFEVYVYQVCIHIFDLVLEFL